MNKSFSVVALGMAVVASVACSSTSFTSTWRDPAAAASDFTGKRVAALVVVKDEARRRAAEDAMARELAKRGVLPIPGYKMVPTDKVDDKSAVQAALRANDIAAAVVMRVIDRRQELNYVPGYGLGGPGYGGYYGYWNYGWSSAGYIETETVLSMETLVYSVPDQKLLWGGVSQTFDPGKVDSVVKDIVDRAVKEMKRAGLIDY